MFSEVVFPKPHSFGNPALQKQVFLRRFRLNLVKKAHSFSRCFAFRDGFPKPHSTSESFQNTFLNCFGKDSGSLQKPSSFWEFCFWRRFFSNGLLKFCFLKLFFVKMWFLNSFRLNLFNNHPPFGHSAFGF